MSDYRIETTGDGSKTIHNSHFDEQYHSRAGAWQEARLKYYKACRIEQKLENQSHLTIFELGFGLGYNLIPILDYLQNNPTKHIHYISCEFDTKIFPTLIQLKSDLYPKKYQSFFELILQEKEFNDEWLNVRIVEDDVRQFIKSQASDSVDAIYHDPFSPYKNTECWTKNLFDQYFRIMKNQAIFSTYSMSTPVRSGLYQAHFHVWEGIGDQSKQSGTIASKTNLQLTELDQKSKDKLHDSPDRIPFMDEELNLDRLEIKRRRLQKKATQDYSDIIRLPQA